MQNLPMPTEENYYTNEMSQLYCGASQFKDFCGYPLKPGCEERALATIRGDWRQDETKALLIGSILDALWEGCTAEELVVRFPDCVSTRGVTAGQLKAEYKQAIELYQRTLKDAKFRQFMSGEKQTIMVGEIEGLPFKIKMDSYIVDKAIVDLKTTQDASMDFRYFIPDSGQRLPFFLAYGYDTQLAIYQNIAYQNTGKKLPCYIAAIDKKSHPLPMIIQIEQSLLDKALEEVKRNAEKIIRLKKGEIDPIRCENGACDYCRDTYECKVMSASEFETHDIGKNDV